MTHGWWESFKRRNPDIVLRKPEPVSKYRADCCTPEVLERYFEELESTLVENEIIDKPAQLFNMESGFPLDPKSPSIACRRGQRHPSSITSGDKTQITVLGCCNAAGYAMPPFVIFKRKTLKPELTMGEVPGTMYGLSSSGWTDTEIFDAWFADHFLQYAPAARPLLLLLDGHSSHYSPATIQKAVEEQIILFCLPPHSTHRTQPLDKGCFAPLKAYWRDECHQYCRENIGKVVTSMQFSQLFSRAWTKGMSIKNVCGGFKTTGIYPFNPHALLPKKPDSTIYNPHSLGKKMGLRYIPLYSPIQKFKKVSHLEPNPSSDVSDATFSAEEIARYQRRYEEGYDLHDERYEKWLKSQYHDVRHSTLYSPIQQFKKASHLEPNPSSDVSDATFSAEEIARYQRRYEEGHDLHDERYEKWLKYQYHDVRHSTPLEESVYAPMKSLVHVPSHHSSLSVILSKKSAGMKLPHNLKTKTSARVLTGAEHLKLLEEKRKKKEEEQMLKEKRKLEREEKRKGNSTCNYCL